MIIKKNKKELTIKENKTDSKLINKSEPDKIEEKVDLFDIDNIDFSQRQERRRGDRRRGYRRIDDRSLISRAQEEAGTIKEQAIKDGYQHGLEEAQKNIEQLKDSIIDFMKAKKEIFEYIAPDILEISVDIARKIIKKEIEQDPEILLETILDVLKNISKEESRVTIKVNPAEAPFIKENLAEILEKSGMEAKINVGSAEEIEIGNCIVYTNNGVVDATINTQLEIIKEAFKGIS